MPRNFYSKKVVSSNLSEVDTIGYDPDDIQRFKKIGVDTWYVDTNVGSLWESHDGRHVPSSSLNPDWVSTGDDDEELEDDRRSRWKLPSWKTHKPSRYSVFNATQEKKSSGLGNKAGAGVKSEGIKSLGMKSMGMKSMGKSIGKDQPQGPELVQASQISKTRKWIILVVIVIIQVIVGLVVVWWMRRKKELDGPKWGKGGDSITMEDGKKFVYNNSLGGTWVSIPFNDTARPQADQPSLREPWDYNKNRIHGVNLGGWLVIEPFISPYLFEPFLKSEKVPIDEWSLMQALGTSAASVIENHYKTFINEEDFAQIAGAGLNWVRIPIGWWLIETMGDEPFLAGVSWKYLLKAFGWARKYGLRINLDLHAVPGSQNNWNHSGRQGQGINFLSGAMGIVNGQRTLNYIRTLTQFISQPQYRNVVPMFSILNEPRIGAITSTAMRSWYYEAYRIIRGIGGTGEGNGPFIVLHDAFQGVSGSGTSLRNPWQGFMNGADRVALDTHPYLSFGGQTTDSIEANSIKPCQRWGPHQNFTMETFGLAMAGEWSLAINDCGLFVNNIGAGNRFDGTYPNSTSPDPKIPKMGDCNYWNDHRQWNPASKAAFAELGQTTQDALINSFFWTWKISHSTLQENPPNPMWNYQLGLASGYINPDARTSLDKCAKKAENLRINLATYPWSGTLTPPQVGGPGAGVIKQADADQIGPFPPAQIGGGPNPDGTYQVSDLPQLSPTGPPIVLKPEPIVIDGKNYPTGNGWYKADDSTTPGYYVQVNGCSYVHPWGGVGIQSPGPCQFATKGGSPAPNRNPPSNSASGSTANSPNSRSRNPGTG